MNRLIALVTLLGVAIAISASEPTDDELAGWWESLSRDERLAELRKLDRVEHATPEIDAPRLGVIQLTDGMIYARWTGPLTLRIAHLEYLITLPDASTQGERPVRREIWFLLGAVSGVATALTLYLLIR